MKVSREACHLAHCLYEASLVEGKLDANRAKEGVDLVLKYQPRHLTQVLKAFLRLVRLELERHAAIIESAVPLEESVVEMVSKALRQRDAQVVISQKVTPALIGGARIRLGSDVWDGTVQSRLARFQYSF
jgi:F-type H+-transporting ATPase subunit delta